MVETDTAEQPLRIVAFGASAGGLQALRPIINGLEPDGNTAYLVAHHISPNHPSSLAELLRYRSTITVVPASHGASLQPDHVYVCPPGHDLEVLENRLVLVATNASKSIAPSIDRLFRSVVESSSERSVVVILSGSGSDGTLGAEAVNAAEGIVIVQLPEEALQPGMPQAAINAGFADLIGNCDQIIAWLNNLEHLQSSITIVKDDSADQAFAQIFKQVADATGLDLVQYKENTLRRQTIRRYRSLGLNSLEQYKNHLATHPDELITLQQTFMISVSSFFRDPEAFDTLEKALRRLVANKVAGDAIRVWAPACATGEEPYSIAILLAEILGERRSKFQVRIFATDIDQRALEFARAGTYSTAELTPLDTTRRQRWFTPEGSGWRINKALRELCVFSLHDVIAHPPFIKMDLISCRNLLIYFKNEQQADLINIFHYGLNPDGLLLLGKSESAGFNSRLFDAIDGSQKLYQRRTGAVAPPARHTRFGAPSPAPRQHLATVAVTPQRQTLVDASLMTIAREYGPPGVLVNASFEPLHFFGRSQRYFSLPNDHADFSVFSLCLPKLRSELKALCYRLIQENMEHLRGAGIDIEIDGEHLRIRPVLRRITQSGVSGGFTFLINFDEIQLTEPAAEHHPETPEDHRAEEVIRLRQELADSREHLQAVIEELEASNEELQSLNEEVQSSSEELQSSNEELQSSNEELTTLNDELRIKSLEAVQLNTTLNNIQNSLRTSLIVVDHEGRITRHNALATRIFGLVANDIGQFIYGIPCHLQLPELRQQVSAVIATGNSFVEQVRQGEFHYLMQIDPYRNELGENVGAVLTFSDISDLHRAEQAIKNSEVRFSHVWEASVEGLLVVDTNGLIVLANPALEKMFGYAADELLGSSVELLIPDGMRQSHVAYRQSFVSTYKQTRHSSLVRNICGRCRDGSELFVEISLSTMEINGEQYVLASASDISERKQAEDALRDREFKLSAIIAYSPSVLSLKYPDGRYALANPNLQKILHLSEAEIVGKTDFDLFPPANALAFQSNDQRVINDMARQSIEEVVPVDGRDRLYISHIFPIEDKGGGLLFICRISLDITDRKAAEQNLQQSEQRLRLAQDAAHAGTWEWYLETNEDFWSDEIWSLYGLEMKSVPASFENWRNTIHPQDRDRVINIISDAATRSAEFETEWQVLLPENEAPRFLLARGRPVRDAQGQPSHYIGIVLDITQRKLAEIALEGHRNQLEIVVNERTRQLSDVYNQAPCGYHTLDDCGLFISMNDTELAWLGYSREELVGHKRVVDLLTPDSYSRFEGNFTELRNTGYLNGIEVDFVRKDGSVLPALLHAKAVVDQTGRFSHSLSTIIDNTARKLTEKAWLAARQAADDANRAKSAFLANMSHEIRTPLNAIIGLGHIMKRGQMKAEQAEQLSKIDSAAQHLLSVINDILDLSKIEADKFVLDEIDFDISAVITRVVSMLQERVSNKGIALKVEGDAFDFHVHGDPTRFTQAVLNLTGNAVKFTDTGSITLNICRQEEKDDRVLVRIEVKDSGIGIPADVLPRLFSAFEQGDASNTRKYGGTGLGLTITKRLAELMGGNAGVTSTEGSGSTFWFTAWLKIARNLAKKGIDLEPTESAECILARDFRGTHVLLVEDEPINQEVAMIFLDDAGLSVSLAKNGVEAVAQARQQKFALVLMDMQMPELDGVEATQQIRALPGWDAVPIIAMTANAFAEDRARCLAAGMNDFLPKPFIPEKFFAMLLHWLEKQRSDQPVP